MKPKTLTQTFNSGIVNIYSVGDIAPPGGMPKEGLTLKVGSLRYHERTVGMNRFWVAMQNQTKVDMVLRAPRVGTVSTHDVAIPVDGRQYKIKQIQYPEDVEPSAMDLSLERLDSDYDLT